MLPFGLLLKRIQLQNGLFVQLIEHRILVYKTQTLRSSWARGFGGDK